MSSGRLGGLQRLGDADGIDDDVVGLGVGGGRDLLQVVGLHDAGAAALHLLEVARRFHVAHEEQAFERLHVGAGGDHVHGDGDARVIGVAEVRQDGFRVLLGLVGDLLAEVVALAELLPDGLDDVVGVAVGLGEDQGLRHLRAAGEDSGSFVAEGADHGADLVGVHHGAVELGGGVVLFGVLRLPALGAGLALALLDQLLGLQLGAGPGGRFIGGSGV